MTTTIKLNQQYVFYLCLKQTLSVPNFPKIVSPIRNLQKHLNVPSGQYLEPFTSSFLLLGYQVSQELGAYS